MSPTSERIESDRSGSERIGGDGGGACRMRALGNRVRRCIVFSLPASSGAGIKVAGEIWARARARFRRLPAADG